MRTSRGFLRKLDGWLPSCVLLNLDSNHLILQEVHRIQQSSK